jgi:hypothetical protein
MYSDFERIATKIGELRGGKEIGRPGGMVLRSALPSGPQYEREGWWRGSEVENPPERPCDLGLAGGR